VIRAYRYRIYPTRAQEARLRETMRLLCELYNAALQERRDAYKKQGRSISEYQQQLELKEVRVVRPEYTGIHVHLLQDAITRLDRAYRAFFRRCKAGETPGFPRFKGRGRYRTFTFRDAINRNGARLVAGGTKVELSCIGKVKVKLHRPIVGTVKQVRVTLAGDGHWYVTFVCDNVRVEHLTATGASVGIDVGVTTFAALSTGETVENPRRYESALQLLKTADRKVTRRKRGSRRRRKAVVLLAKQHDRVRRARLDFHHKAARGIVARFDSVAVENLSIKGLAQMRLAKQVHDAGWAQFIRILAYKAESAGREFIKVEPRGTSQECSGCGATVRKSLSVRVHDCPHCGLVLDRDVNAAKNVQSRGHRDRGGASCKRLVEPRSRSEADNAS